MKLQEILKNKNKLKDKVFYIGMLGLGIEDIIKHQHIFNENDIFIVK